jgi:hypothetical protein
MGAVRTLPIRVAPLPGEAIDSWLHAAAARMGVSWGDFLSAVGLAPSRFGLDTWVVQPLPQEMASIAAATDIDPGCVAAMTLAHYAGRVLQINTATRRVTGTALWRGPGSPYCPQCLAEKGGRWLLRWRTGWSFVCVEHRCLLAHTCPACGRRVGTRSLLKDAVPVLGCCANPPAGAVTRTRQRCNADLRTAVVHVLPECHPALIAQRIVDDLIDATGGPFGVYRLSPQSSLGVLGDLRAVALQVLTYCSGDDLAARLPADLVQLYRAGTDLHDGESPRRAGSSRRRPADAAAVAIGVTAAVASLDHEDIATAGEALRWLVTRIRDQSPALQPRLVGRSRVPVTTVLEAVRLAALAPILNPTAQLRYRTATPMPALASSRQSRINRLIKHTPTMFWPEWSLRLTIPGVTPSRLRPALAIATLLVGTRITLSQAATRIASRGDTSALSHVLGVMSRHDDWSAIGAAVTVLSDYLADADIPIDYQRRRQVNYSTLLPDAEWVRICRDTATPGRFAARARIARGYLFERVSALPVTAAPFGADRELRRKISAFPRHLTPELAAALDDHCSEWLAAHDIRDEPVVWQPPLAAILGSLPLPGDDPHALDIPALHRMIRDDHCRLGVAAQRLNTSWEAARYLLTVRPAPALPLITTDRGRRYGTSYRIAKAVLTPERFRDLYETRGVTAASLCAQIGVDHKTLTQLARDYAIPIRGPSRGNDILIDRDWLYEQYFHQRRDIRELARERGISRDTMSKWLQIHHIPKRPKLGRPPDLAVVARAPAVLRPALMGNGGWERLCRFAIASDYSSLRAAAEHLEIDPSMLVVQINRIERDLGETLLTRAQRGHSMQLTVEGTRVLAAITTFQRQLNVRVHQ